MTKSDALPPLPPGWLHALQQYDDTNWINMCFSFGLLLAQPPREHGVTSGCLWSFSRTFVSRRFHCYLEQVPPMNKDVRLMDSDSYRFPFRRRSVLLSAGPPRE